MHLQSRPEKCNFAVESHPGKCKDRHKSRPGKCNICFICKTTTQYIQKKGAVYENLAADIFGKMGRKLYYFQKEGGLELDFLIRYRGECCPVECKARTGNAKSLKTIMKNPDHYHVCHAIKLSDYNVGGGQSSSNPPVLYGIPIDRGITAFPTVSILFFINSSHNRIRIIYPLPKRVLLSKFTGKNFGKWHNL